LALIAAFSLLASPSWSEASIELEMGATGKFKGNPIVKDCRAQLSTRVARAGLDNEPPPDVVAKPAKNVRYLSLTLEVTNQSPKGGSLCDLYSGHLVKTEFKLLADDEVLANKFPIFKWPSIDRGTTKDVKLLFEFPENARKLVLTGHFKEDHLATWTLPELPVEYLAEQAENTRRSCPKRFTAPQVRPLPEILMEILR
jgi:hypothetical protein